MSTSMLLFMYYYAQIVEGGRGGSLSWINGPYDTSLINSQAIPKAALILAQDVE